MAVCLKKRLCLIALIAISTSVFAHDPDKAFFRITKKENTTEVIAELPWSIRNAIIDFNPALAKTSNQEAFDTTFFKYIKENFILYTKDGDILKLESVELQPKKEHSHAGKYLFVFNGIHFIKVVNTFLFNLYDQQVNYHKLKKGANTYEFTTSKKNPEWVVAKDNIKAPIKYFLFLLGTIFIVYLVISLRKRIVNDPT